jgi:ribosomal protein S18 acetylase RimI-like enzyme
MNITYNNQKKDLPIDQLRQLFYSVGWMESLSKDEPEERLRGFMQPWLNSTLVVSAWDGDRLVGAVRVLSDTIFRSVIYDLLVDPDYQRQGIGRELVKVCKNKYPNSEWIVGCDKKNNEFYKKLEFQDILESGNFLVIPCKLF